MEYRIFLGALLLTGAVFCQESVSAQTGNGTAPQNKVCKVQKDEIEIFASFLKQGESAPVQTVVTTETEAIDVDVDYENLQLAVKGQGIPSEIRADFKAKNKSNCLIEPFTGVTNLHFISRAEQDRLFRAGWTEFHKKYGKNAELTTFSRIGFNADKNLALLHVSSGVDHNAAGGALYLLEKKAGKWLIKSHIGTWTT